VLGGPLTNTLEWPEPVEGEVIVSIRVPPKALREVVGRLAPDWDYVAQFGVGEVTVGLAGPALDALTELRGLAESVGGALVLIEAPESLYADFDPWGTPPGTLHIQQRLIARFDPARVVNPGRLPGGI
jgi:hypothetical protein